MQSDRAFAVAAALDSLVQLLRGADISHSEIIELRDRLSEADRLLARIAMQQPEAFGEGGDY